MICAKVFLVVCLLLPTSLLAEEQANVASFINKNVAGLDEQRDSQNIQMSAEELIALAKELLAEFTKTALQRLYGEVFGRGRAARSSDIVIINTTGKRFFLEHTECEWGGFSSEMFPETEIPAHSSTVWGIESNGFLAGVECTVGFRNVDDDGVATGLKFSMYVDNPYFGSNKMSHTGDFEIVDTLGQGNNNQVRFLILN